MPRPSTLANGRAEDRIPQRDSGEHCRADQQGLLQDEHKGRWHDVARRSRRPDRRLAEGGYQLGYPFGELSLDEATIGARAPPAASSDDKVLIAVAMPLDIDLKMNR